MNLRDQFLTEFDLEIPFLREHIARVPDDKLNWKPHERSMLLGHLAAFCAMIWSWGATVAEQESFDVAKAMADGLPPLPKSTQEILGTFDAMTSAARTAIAKADVASFEKPWTLLANGNAVFTKPRWLVLRTMVMNHAVHHRAQLGVYLRLLDVPVPAVYNDSADEKGGIFAS
jgi:uncharacterized damage-inducible protein DinB